MAERAKSEPAEEPQADVSLKSAPWRIGLPMEERDCDVNPFFLHPRRGVTLDAETDSGAGSGGRGGDDEEGHEAWCPDVRS